MNYNSPTESIKKHYLWPQFFGKRFKKL